MTRSTRGGRLVSAVLALFFVATSGAGWLSARQTPTPDALRRLETFDAAWRIVRDTHFDPALNGVDWNAVRDELRPRAAAATNDDELRAVIADMLGRIHQSHFVLLPSGSAGAGLMSGDPAEPERETDSDAGLDVRLIDREIVVATVRRGGPASEAGIRPGWVLLATDSVSLPSMAAGRSSGLDPRLAELETWRAATERLRGPEGSEVRLDLIDGSGSRQTRTLRRAPAPGEAVSIGNLPAFRVRVSRRWIDTPAGLRAGVIRFNVWVPAIDAGVGAAVDEFRDAAGLVIDLRGNPGGLAAMIMGIAGYVLDRPLVLGTMKTRDSELRFVANPRRVNAAGVRVAPYAGPVAILVDGLTASASECFAGGLQALGRARVFGEPSMGQALPALFDRLPGGDVLIHAYGDFVTARGDRLEGVGVRPDEAVAVTRADLLSGVDRPLETALEWVDRTRR
jgi:carboxyl-terminal processing protease